MSANKPDISQIRKYLSGELDAKAMHQLEREAQDDPFLMEAMEGYALADMDQQANLADLQQRLADRVAPKKERSMMLWRVLPIAASLLIAISIGYVLLKPAPVLEKAKSFALLPSPATQTGNIPSKRDTVIKDTSKQILIAQNPLPVGRILKRKRPAQNHEELVDEPAGNADINMVTKDTTASVVVASLGLAKAKTDTSVALGNTLAARLQGDEPIVLKKTDAYAKRNLNKVAGVVKTDSTYIKPVLAQAKKPDIDSVSYLAEVVVPGYADKNDSPVQPADGWKKYLAYIKEQAIMPDNTVGKVKLAFKIGKDGLIYAIRILRSSDIMLNQKAIEILKNGPAWIGKINADKEIKVKIKFHKKPNG